MRRYVILALAVLLGGGLVGAADEAGHGPPPPDDARFEFLKGLVGTWVGETGMEGMPTGRFEFRLTAGGHAIEETEFIGTPMEMLTVYHMEGDDLVATHYCAMGNQPRVRAVKKVVRDTLTFDCDGTPGNAKSHDEAHIHGWSMRLAADGKLHYASDMVGGGKETETHEFVMSRQSDAASR